MIKKILANKKIKISIIIGLFLFITPIVAFILKFHSHEISNDITKWGAFGDYFAGILNTIISFFSLIILGFLTYELHKNSTKENKNLFNYQKKIEAYDELAKSIPVVNILAQRLGSIIESYNNTSNPTQNNFDEFINRMNQEIFKYHEYHFFLFNFNVRYSILFKYDFTSNEYQKLINTSRQLIENLNLLHQSFLKGKPSNAKIESIALEHVDLLTDFINELREEISPEEIKDNIK